ncbi:MAG: family 16 glycoside hydrolase [Cyanobacteria bacterium J06621_15]
MVLNRLVDSGESIKESPAAQRTTFALDGISRFVCNTWDEIQAAQQGGQFDVVVVGSGMYGAYCATKIFEFTQNSAVKPRILVLEAGPFLISEHFQNLTRIGGLFNATLEPIVDSDLAKIDEPNYINQGKFNQHHRCVGGKSIFWGGWTPRLTDTDLDKWPQDVKEYLNQPDGYEFVEKEIGAVPTADFMNGDLLGILKNKAQEVSAANGNQWKIEDAPIAVLGQSPGSGLFSMDKFSSLPLLLDNIRQDTEESGSDNNRRLFLVPNAEVLKLETQDSIVNQVVVALKNPFAENPKDTTQAQVVRLGLKPSAVVILAGNTINSTRIALNSFPRPKTLAPNSELMGRNLMAHVRGNFVWKVKRDLLGVPNQLKEQLQTAALNIRGTTDTDKGVGQFHFQFYAAPNMNTNAFPGAANNPEEFLYRMVPNFEELQDIIDAQTSGSMENRIVIGIRTCGEMFGDKQADIENANSPTSWMNTNPFGGIGDDVYRENGQDLRIPKAFVRFVETPADKKVREDQSVSAFNFIDKLAGQPADSSKNTNKNNDPNVAIEHFSGKDNNPDEDGIGTTYHECGTLWMGTEYDKSVTDVNGRFHHVYNAYCVDQALFTTSGSANPVPTGLALARKVARSIVERYQSSNITDESGFQNLYKGNFAADGWKYTDSVVNSQPRFLDINIPGNQPILEAGKQNSDALGILWYSSRTYSDFILKLEWKAFDWKANSGIFLRIPEPSETLNDSFYDSSIEVQIDEKGYDYKNETYGSPLHRTGAVYELFPAQQWAAKHISSRNSSERDFWNSYEIKLQGNLIEVKLNDKVVSAGTFSELLGFDAPSDGKKKRSEGYIGLQCHTDVVQFRNIRIKAL